MARARTFEAFVVDEKTKAYIDPNFLFFLDSNFFFIFFKPVMGNESGLHHQVV